MALQLILLPVSVAWLANSAIAEQPDLSKLNLLPPETKKSWDSKQKQFPVERIAPDTEYHIDGSSHAKTASNQSSHSDTQHFSLPGTSDTRASKSSHFSEDPWQQLERVLQPASGEQLSNIAIKCTQNFRYIKFNGAPDKSLIGFPRIANWGAPEPQQYTLRMPVTPEPNAPASPLHATEQPFGIALNGVLITRGPDAYWRENRHAISKDTLNRLRQCKCPTLIGYAADGYPIYGPYGYKRANDNMSPLEELKPNDLDEYNGRFGVTAEFPSGTYYYVLSNSYPFIPCALRGEADKTFRPQEKRKDPKALHEYFEGRHFLK